MSGVGKVAGGMAQAGPAIAKGVAQVGGALARTAPSVVAASESVLEAALSVPPEFEFGAVAPVRVSVNGDPCGACPLDAECGECVGYAGYACLASPAGALARCESSAPPDAAPAPDPAPDPAADPAGVAPPPAPAFPAAPDPSLPPPAGPPPAWFMF